MPSGRRLAPGSGGRTNRELFLEASAIQPDEGPLIGGERRGPRSWLSNASGPIWSRLRRERRKNRRSAFAPVRVSPVQTSWLLRERLRSTSAMPGRLPKGLGRVRRPLIRRPDRSGSHRSRRRRRQRTGAFGETSRVRQSLHAHFLAGSLVSTDLEDATLSGGSARPKMGEITHARRAPRRNANARLPLGKSGRNGLDASRTFSPMSMSARGRKASNLARDAARATRKGSEGRESGSARDDVCVTLATGLAASEPIAEQDTGDALR